VLDKAGWYAKGTVPGQTGPAVIAGHVDWVDRIAVFHRLDELQAGDRITVIMDDRTKVVFAVDDVRKVSKLHFPTASVYGPTPDPQLRVITCGGPWDDARDIYSENVVVSASEVG
jgi:sortase (surface protein transpeptidase)